MSSRYPAVLSRRITSAVPDMDLPNDNECITRVKKCRTKLVKRNMEGHSSFLARWHNEYSYRDSLTRIGWTEQDIMLFDRITWENHSYVATRAERIRNSEHWILKLNQDGAQQPINQRPDFAQTKRECKRLHDEYMARTPQEYRTSPRSQQVRRRKEQAFRRN